MPSRRLILHVDDNAVALYARSRVLRRAGFEVIEVRSGLQALQTAQKVDPALIILDVKLPDMDGFETCRQLRQHVRTAHIPILHVSAEYSADEHKAKGLESGADAYLCEPLHPDVFLGTVKALLRARTAEDELRTKLGELEAVNSNLNALIGSSSDSIKTLDLEGRLLSMNSAGQKLLEIEDLSRYLNTSWLEFWQPQDRARVQHAIQLAAHGGVGRFQACGTTVSAKRRWWDVIVTPLQASSGSVDRLLAISRDITENKEAEQGVAAARWRAEMLAQVSTELLAHGISAESLNHIFAPLAERLGLDAFIHYRAEAEHQALHLAAQAGLDAAAVRKLQRIGYGETICGQVAQTQTLAVLSDLQNSTDAKADGLREVGFTAYVCQPLLARGRLAGTLGFGTRRASKYDEETLDLLRAVGDQIAIALARHEAEEGLRASEARFRQLAEAMPQIVWTARPDGHVDYVNARFREYIGQDIGVSGELLWLPFVHPDEQNHVVETWRDCVRRGGNYQLECRLQHRSGEYRWNLVRALPARDEAGEITRWFGTSTDIHDQKLTEKALKDAHRRKDDFLALLGHELRNPLAPIRTAAQILKRAGTDSAAVQRSREMIDRQTTQMARLIDDLLDVSRITSGKIPLKKQPVDITEIVRNFAGDYRSIIESGGLHFELCLPKQPLYIFGDPARLQQIVGNLLNNAVKFTDAGGKVSLSVGQDDSQALIIVQDSGIGMERHILERIFEPFSQADSSIARSRGGLGLGLALVKGLTELHGGSVRAESRGIGQGSRFIVLLPLEKNSAVPPQPTEVVGAKRSHRILIIEDNVDAAESLRMLLQLVGHEVATAYSGFEGLRRAREFSPDVILCDIGLPGELDGYAVARAVREDDSISSPYMVAMTGYGQEEDRKQALQAGFDHHITKPADPEALERLLER